MSQKAVAGALIVAFLAAGPGAAWADPPPPASAAPAAPSSPSPPAAPAPPAAQPYGALVVAVGEGAAPAAKALAYDVYRDPALRPPIDEATAQVLAGAPPAAGAAPRLVEIAALRDAVAKAEPGLVQRRLLASLGGELSATLVVAVTLDAGRPVARALRSAGGAQATVELGATVDTAPDGTRTYRWPGAPATLRGILGIAPPAVPEPLRPLSPKAPAAPPERPFYKSPWFWGTAGVVAAAGISVLILSRTTGGPNNVHLTGKVGP
jgi:hypothetical protein